VRQVIGKGEAVRDIMEGTITILFPALVNEDGCLTMSY